MNPQGIISKRDRKQFLVTGFSSLSQKAMVCEIEL
jgi:hypothetical protein